MSTKSRSCNRQGNARTLAWSQYELLTLAESASATADRLATCLDSKAAQIVAGRLRSLRRALSRLAVALDA